MEFAGIFCSFIAILVGFGDDEPPDRALGQRGRTWWGVLASLTRIRSA